MSNDLNNCQFIGRLGKDPELRALPSGESVVNFSIAVGWKTKDKEGTEWVSVNAFGKLAEICSQYLRKGSQVFVQGRLRTDKYTKDGVERFSTKIIADKMQMLSGKGESTGKPAQAADDSQPPAEFDDDIPF